MSVSSQKHLSNNESNKKNDKTLKPLFPKQAECSYVSCYWYVIHYFTILLRNIF